MSAALAPIPPSRHPYADLLGAMSAALCALEVQSAVHVRALAGIDFDLPPGTPSVEDRAALLAAAPLYFASELERAGLLTTAELIAGLFASGTINQPLGPVAKLLHEFWRGRRERLDVNERDAIFARVLEAPHYDRLMRALCESIVVQAEGRDLGRQVVLASHAQSLASFLAQRVDPMAVIAARDIVRNINTALVFLRDRALQSAFAVSDLWRLVAIVGSQGGTVGGSPQVHVERGRSGQTVLLWLSEHYAESAIRLDPRRPEHAALTVAAHRWLASQPLADPSVQARVGMALLIDG